MINQKRKGMKIAGAALALFLTGKSVQALTPENVSEIKTAFRANNSSYVILNDGSITSTDKNDRIIWDSEKKRWTSNDGTIMSAQFQYEAEKVLEVANEEEKRGMKLVDFFEYTNNRGETNLINVWPDGESFGPYQIENRAFYDGSKNPNLNEKDGYMSGAFNTKVRASMILALSELVSLREAQEKTKK